MLRKIITIITLCIILKTPSTFAHKYNDYQKVIAWLANTDPHKSPNLRNLDLSNLVFDGADFSGADLTDSNLSRTSLFRAKFIGATLTWTNFTWATALLADFSQSILDQTIFNNAHLSCANFLNAQIISPQVFKANFVDAKNISQDFTMYIINHNAYILINGSFSITNQSHPHPKKARSCLRRLCCCKKNID
jgi:hypothetical protein